MSKGEVESVRSWEFDEKSISYLHEALPGKIFVNKHQNDSKTTKTIVQARGNEMDLKSIQAQVHLHKMGGNVLKLQVGPLTKIEGHILMEIFLDEDSTIRHVESYGSSQLIIEDNVLTNNSLVIDKVGSGAIYLNLVKDMNLKELAVSLTGSGAIAWIAPMVSIEKSLTSTLRGSGQVSFHTKHLRSPKITSNATGSGSILYNATDLIAYELASSVVGSGSIRYLRAGSVDHHIQQVIGSGKIINSALLANSVTASINGSGSIVTQALEELRGDISGSGRLEYVGPKPKSILVQTSGRRHGVQLVERKESPDIPPPSVPSRDLSGFQLDASLFGGRLKFSMKL